MTKNKGARIVVSSREFVTKGFRDAEYIISTYSNGYLILESKHPVDANLLIQIMKDIEPNASKWMLDDRPSI